MLRQGIHIVLSVVILLSSSGLLVNQHFCLDELVSTAFYSQAKKCAAVKTSSHSPSTPFGKQLSDKGCCDDASNFFKVSNEQRGDIATLHLILQKAEFAPALKATCMKIHHVIPGYFMQKKPPLPSNARLALLQRFLC